MDASYVVPEAFLKKRTQNTFTEREIIKKCLETVADIAPVDTHTHTLANARAIIKNEIC